MIAVLQTEDSIRYTSLPPLREACIACFRPWVIVIIKEVSQLV